ncbi:hypothetical protein ACJU26_08655 [Acidithiobacillus sp. M4-SHS-6]|uniref:hypothetical protein n=1 Tax=Acidithiobacillus sp. M4-SHS-6 TaxID=3383024 RepID=UPI0039BDC2E1
MGQITEFFRKCKDCCRRKGSTETSKADCQVPEEKLWPRVLRHKDNLDFLWTQGKRLALLSLLFGQAMVIYFYAYNGIVIQNISHYLVISMEALSVTFVTVLFIVYYASIPTLCCGFAKSTKGWILYGIFFALFLIINVGPIFYYGYSNTLGYIVLGVIVFMNVLFEGIMRLRRKYMDVVLVSAPPVILMLIFLAFAFWPLLRNGVMREIGVLQAPNLLFIKDKTPLYNRLLLKTSLNNGCKQVVKKCGKSGYTGYPYTHDIYIGNGEELIKVSTKTCQLSFVARNRANFFFWNPKSQPKNKKYLQHRKCLFPKSAH